MFDGYKSSSESEHSDNISCQPSTDDEAPGAAAASLVTQSAALASSSTVISGAVKGGRPHPGVTQHTLGVCCVRAEYGADIEKIAVDLRTLKAGVTMVVVDTVNMAIDLGRRLRDLPAYVQYEDGTQKERECQFLSLSGETWFGRDAMFCGSTQAVTAVERVGTFYTPGGGIINIAEYDLRATCFGTACFRVALLLMPPTKLPGSENYSWSDVALRLIGCRVRIIGCTEFENNHEHPLIKELNKYYQTNYIRRGTGSGFPICVLGEVSRFQGKPMEVTVARTQEPPMNEYKIVPTTYSITVYTPAINVEKTVKGIISLDGRRREPA